MADLKLETLIKVLMMTTSDTDGEALAAIRRANSMLKTAHVDWSELLHGKVTVVADPFDSIAAPRKATSSASVTVPRPPQAPTSPFRSATPASPPPPPPSSYRRGNTNRFAAECLTCNAHVDVGYGALFSHTHNGQQTTWVLCEPCNDKNRTNQYTSAFINAAVNIAVRRKATQARARRATFTGTCYNCDNTSTTNTARAVSGTTNQLFCIRCDEALDDGSLNMNAVITNRQTRLASRGPRTKRKVTTADLMKDIDF